MDSEQGKRIVGVDYGSKRVGLAITDPLRMFAQPYGAFSPEEAIAEIGKIARKDGVESIIIGWPLTLEGKEGDATGAVRGFLKRLSLALPGIPVQKVDERYTSEIASHAIRAGGARKKARQAKSRVDAAAAAVILQEYLDGSGTVGPER